MPTINNSTDVRPARLDEFARVIAPWIHADISRDQWLDFLEPQLRRLHAFPVPAPYVAWGNDGSPLAAAYFTQLPGSVATLGGVRARPGAEVLARDLVQTICTQMRWQKVPQVQAILRSDDLVTADILASSGFRHLSTVQHMWLTSVDAAMELTNASQLRETLRWHDASEIPFRRLAQLVDDTFVGTLDCPELNGLRSQRQVLDGFLEGVALRDIKHWEVLDWNGEMVGCLFVKLHPHQTIELGYMGIVPNLRGWGLGRELMHRLMHVAKRLGAMHAVVAVDIQNTPAIHLYLRHGFVADTCCNVWLLDNHTTQRYHMDR